jgi:DtxR family Mn-dependent transcriptional regulator
MDRISIEDYSRSLSVLFEQCANYKEHGIKSIDVANKLQISKASVSEMLKKLKNLDFITQEPYSNIFLTRKGFAEAERIIHNHRVIEVFLSQVLGMDNNVEVHLEAHKLEHAFSDNVISKLDKFLNNPNVSPHGKSIPHKYRKDK